MMAADQQFELYLTLSETSRGGGTGVENTAENSGPKVPMHHAVDKARNAAVNFADVVRRRAFQKNALNTVL